MAHIEMKNITKVYPTGVVANNNACLSIKKGEIHAVAGENGAGKSTIMKVLYGAEKASGDIFIDDKKVIINSPKDASLYGIGMVYQHFMLVNEFTVWENIFFGNEMSKAFGFLNKKEMIQKANELCTKYNMPLNVMARCSNLTVSEAQKTEILKVLAQGAKIIILDEPTAVLTPQETQQLFQQLRLLKKSGFTIIIITHKLREIKELCDRVTIMRQGCTVGTYSVKNVTEEDISRLMVGRDIKTPKKAKPKTGKPVLKVNGLTVTPTATRKEVKNVSFGVNKGEILCFAGVEGNGQHEVINAITSTDKDYSGSIFFCGNEIKEKSISQIRESGLAYIPEDRLKTGSVASFSVFENLISDSFSKESKFGFIQMKELKEKGKKQIKDYGVKGTLSDSLSSLSGGNMQKVIIAREFSTNPLLVVADQPTRGVDIGAIESIHEKIISIRDSGKAVILVSADLSEVLTLSDRILVFHNGEITANIKDVSKTNEIELGQYMLGLKKMEDVQ